MSTKSLLISIVTISCFLTACSDKDKLPVEVMATSQGYLEGESENLKFINSDTVKHRVGERVYWYAKIRTNKTIVKFTEEVKMNGPTTWDKSKTELKYSEDKSTAIVDREYKNKRGLISGSWTLNKDDPAGKMEINVLIENKIPLKFVWQVVDEPNGK
jgi:hypothetical protein